MKRALVFMVALLAAPLHAFYPEWVTRGMANLFETRKLLTADFNGDERPDTLVRSGELAIRLMLTQSDGTFGAPLLVHEADYLGDMLIADVDGDGKADVVAADKATNTIVVRFSNGDGTFDAPVVTPLPMAPTQIVAGDFDEDDAVDLAIRSYSADQLAIYTGDGAGHFTELSRDAIGSAPYAIRSGDIDHDGHEDLLIANSAPLGYDLYFGRGDGGFDAPVSIAAVAPYLSLSIGLADLDADGDLELLSCEFAPSTVTVVLNLGSRNFAAPVTYAAITPSGPGNCVDFVVADVTEDGHVDVVVTLANARALATLEGNGTGSLGAPRYASVPQANSYSPAFPNWLTAADYTGDGRIDLAVSTSNYSRVILFENTAGGSGVGIFIDHPTTSAGQNVTVTATVSTAAGFLYPYLDPPPYPTGTVTLKEGAITIATGILDHGIARISVNSLPVGVHAMTVAYGGDDLFHPSVSNGFTHHVVAQRTTTTLTKSATGSLRYGENFSLTATVTSPIPGSVYGSFYLYTDGQRSEYSQSATSPSWHVAGNLLVGTHTFYVEYEGNATQPPSTSNVITQEVTKAGSLLTIPFPPASMQYGQTPELRVSLESVPWGSWPQGPVGLYEGSTLLATQNGTNGNVYFTIPVLPAGVHYLHAEYAGDANFEGSTSAPVKITVAPAGAFVVDASATPTTISVTGYNNNPGLGTQYRIWRRKGSAPWEMVRGNTFYPSWSESSPEVGTIYSFRMEAVNISGQVIATSNTDVAMIASFTDDPVVAGVVIKAIHVKELVDAINVMRGAAGLPPVVLTDAGAGHYVRAAHFVALYDAVNQARLALGAAAVSTPSDLTTSGIIRTKHLQDLREALR